MNDIITIPTVEQINLEHRLANSKASEAVQHATNCGLMLLQIKASLNHGEWLPWLNGEIEAGRLEVKRSQANTYMRVASNYQRAGNLEGVTSIRAALELLSSDKEPEAEAQGTLIDVEAERQAREAAEAKAEAERQARERAEADVAQLNQRNADWREQSLNQRNKIRELESQIDLLEKQPKPEPEKIVVKPDDYETAKTKAAQLETELANLKKEQANLINNQVKAKLHERQAELDKLEQDKQLLDEVVSRKKAYLASIDSDIKRIETHQKVIEENRLHLISLAAFLSDEEPVQDADTRKRWNALADMLAEAMTSVRQYAGDARPALSVIRGDAA